MDLRKMFMLLTAISVSQMIASGAFAATVSGNIKYSGDVPKFQEIKMEADPICLSKHTSPVYPETLVLGADNAMANVFVRVKSGLAQQNYAPPAEPVLLDQLGCHYNPHVFGVMVGQSLKILNSDGTLHNVHILSKVNPEVNLAMPQFRKETEKKFDKEEFMFPLKCDVHPWMESWCAVMSHPFFNVTKEDGKFSIANLPAGTYDIEAWHEKLGTQTQTVTVTADENKEVSFTFSRPSK